MRKALEFPPFGSWKSYNETKPSQKEIALAPSVEAYYNLKEQNLTSFVLMNLQFEEPVQARAVEYLDEMAPQIRASFKARFEKVRRLDNGVVDRKVVDRMVEEFKRVQKTVRDAIVMLMSFMNGNGWERPRDNYANLSNITFVHPDSFMANPVVPINKFSNVSCLSDHDYTMLWNNTFTKPQARLVTQNFFHPTTNVIGYQEIRKVLGLSPTFPWAYKSPTEEEYEKDNDTLEEYISRPSTIRTLLYNYFNPTITEHGVKSAIVFFDYRLPEIRSGFKTRFQEMRRENGGWVNQKLADKMIKELLVMTEKKEMQNLDCGPEAEIKAIRETFKSALLRYRKQYTNERF